ncbi:PTS sugar transporter subunit IIA [Brotaphodocola sp.]|uniref:PTS sugar transporter subunit IIA n=1 Tax=Brotaphodocola sp. TaxID=3073577 RepID=UPI003D7D192E
MKYVVLVSHGTFAPGLHSVLNMLAGGGREDILSTSLQDGMGADEFAENFGKLIEPIKEDDEIILLADIIGGSPLTTALDVLTKKGLLAKTTAFGGMNLPMALTATLMKDALDTESLKASLVSESRDAIKEMELKLDDDEEDDI